jgi:coatomer subunit beta
MDVLQVLSSADIEVRRKAMSVVLSMTSSRNVEEVVLFLKKQLLQTQEQDFEKVCTPSFSLYRRFTIVLGT